MDFSGQIVVGHDDSAESATAVRWAAQLAKASGKELTIVHAWIWPLLTENLGPVDGVADSGLRNAAKDLLRRAAELAEVAAPGVAVNTALITGQGRTVLSHVSESADLLVVGSRGLGGFLGMLLGSVSLDLISHAGCPVVVIRAEDKPAQPVLVGVDGSEAGLDAVDTGVRLAQAWNAPLEIVHVRRAISARSAQTEEDAQQVLDAGVARAREHGGDIEVTSRLIESRTVPRALLEAAQDARIIVLGYQGTGRRRLGSTAHAVVHHAPGNAAIIRHVHVPIDTDEPKPEIVEEG
ncbi:universal stress protein [Brevibacterium daeguense]|uniref:Universal stress protein n=1 Tax=Brevibacterium daeguense TaxID=909936 RepID=A0ABP8EH43_9MICO